jgi:hypothetical protein
MTNNHDRQRLIDRLVLLKMELGRTPRRQIGTPLWQHRARKLLGCLRRLEQIDRLPKLRQRLEEVAEVTVA